MSTKDDRINKLIAGAYELYKFNGMHGDRKAEVSIFKEDWDFLVKNQRINNFGNGFLLDGTVPVKQGPRKRRQRKKRPQTAIEFS